jgi:uncharacterized protein (DUF2267 family)
MMSTIFQEQANAPTKVGNSWRAVLITPGKGSSGVYPEAMLREYGPKAFPKGTHSYVDHPSREDEVRSPKNLMGILSEDAYYEDGVGLVAELQVMPHWKEFVESVAPHTGLSIYAMGEGEYDDDGEMVVETLVAHTQNSVDLVSYPGRPGSKLADKLYEAARAMIEAGADELKRGDSVSWNSSGGPARGRIERIVRNGNISVPDSDFTISGTSEDPAALIRLYRDGERTDTVVGHKFSTLTKISDLDEAYDKDKPRRKKEAEPGELAEEDLVRMDHGGEMVYGQVAYIMTDGVFPFEGDPLAVPASPEAPVALVRVWRQEDGEWEPTQMLMGHPISELTKVSELGESKTRENGNAAKTVANTKSYKEEGNSDMDLKELSDMLAELPNLVAAAVVEALAPNEEPEEEEKQETDVAAVAEALVAANLPEVSRKAVYESLRAGADLTESIENQKAFVESVKSHFKEEADASAKAVEETVIVNTQERAPRLSEILNVKVGA